MKAVLKSLAQHLLHPLRNNHQPGGSASYGRDTDCCWVEDYLIGKSDTDAWWYYERRRWRD